MIKDYKGAKLYYLPWYDKENTTFIDLARVIDLAFRVLQEKIDIVDRNLFIDTALEALPIFQRDLGLQISEEVSIEQKRKIIQGYLHYLHEQTTEEVVRELCKSYGNMSVVFDIEKADEVDTYNILMRFRNGNTNNIVDLLDMLSKVLPAHLDYILRILMSVRLIYQDKLKSYETKFWMTNQIPSGRVPTQSYRGIKSRYTLRMGSSGRISDNKPYKTNEIRANNTPNKGGNR